MREDGNWLARAGETTPSEVIFEKLDQLERGFDDIEHRIFNMDKEHTKYIRATVTRLNYLLNKEDTMKGVIIDLLNHLSEVDGETRDADLAKIGSKMNLSQFTVLSEKSLYKRKKQKVDFAESVESLRNAFPKLTGGWTIYPVEKTLERHGVSYMQRQVSMQNMIEDLKAGKILFCQCNDYDVRESGHCFVIYGYKTSGDSTWFLLHDPAAIGSDAYGKEKNRAKWMDVLFGHRTLMAKP